MSADEYRKQAERCRRLARESTDPRVIEDLIGAAKEYEAKARQPEPGRHEEPS